MPNRALAQGGPRPAESLPCTLLPNAVLMAAPPSDRVASLFAACVVYAALGSALIVLAKDKGRSLAFGHRPVEIVFERPDAPVLAPVQPPARFSGNNQRPPGAPSIPSPALPDQVPVSTPSALPTENHAWDGRYTPDQPMVPHGTGREEPAVSVPVRVVAPVAMDLKDMRVLSQVNPVYPPLARLARIQGSVELLMIVDGRGVPAEVRVLGGPHPSLCNEALRVARLWRFEPALAQGQPVPAQFRLTVVFRLAS